LRKNIPPAPALKISRLELFKPPTLQNNFLIDASTKKLFFKLVGDAPPFQESKLGKGRGGPAQGVCSPSSKNNFVLDASSTKLFFDSPQNPTKTKQANARTLVDRIDRHKKIFIRRAKVSS